jgi:type IV secretion system protein VirB4
MNALKKYRSTKPGLPNLLNYGAVVDDGVILNKDGSLMAGWYYRGEDNASNTDEERNNLSARVNAALARLGSGWMSHHDAIRLPARDYPAPEASFFPDPISQLIDEERREQFQAEGAHYESHYALAVTYLPPLARQSRIGELMFDDKPGNQKSVAQRLLDYFKRMIAELEDGLAGSVKLERMRGRRYEDGEGNPHLADELLQYLHFSITGENHPINLPLCPMYIDAIIGGREFFSGLTPKIGDTFILPISLDGFPAESYPGILSVLDQLPMPYRWSTRFVYLDSHEAAGELKKYQRKWKQKVRGFIDQVFKTSKGNVDQDAVAMVGDVEDALSEASSGLVTYGYYTSVIILMHESREVLEAGAREARRAIQNLGFSCRLESVNAVDAWLGTLPGHGVPNLRRPMLHTMNLADMLPLSSIWPGKATCPCPFYPPDSPPLLHAATEGATPFRFNLHVGDLGHTLVLGPTGSGKSTLLALIVAQFRRYSGATIFAFDKGRSLSALVNACGGVHHDIAAEHSDLAFAPLAGIHEESECAWAEEWIASVFELQDVRMTPELRNEVHRAMKLLAEAPVEGRTLTAFQSNLQQKMLRDAINPYTLAGNMGRMLDAERDGLTLSAFQVFEIEDLMNMGNRNALPVLTYLFRRIEKALKGQPAILVLDEAWLMLGHPIFRAKIREWLKVLRKANCIVLLATQSLSDAASSGILDVLLESCPTKVLLPNENAEQKGSGGVIGPRDFYSMIGLNDRQIAIIQQATPKRHYYCWSAEGRRLIDLNLGPVALSFVGASSKKDLTKIAHLKATHGDQWPLRWLDSRGVEYRHLLPESAAADAAPGPEVIDTALVLQS